jgi:hypothetical protein
MGARIPWYHFMQTFRLQEAALGNTISLKGSSICSAAGHARYFMRSLLVADEPHMSQLSTIEQEKRFQAISVHKC